MKQEPVVRGSQVSVALAYGNDVRKSLPRSGKEATQGLATECCVKTFVSSWGVSGHMQDWQLAAAVSRSVP